MANGKIVKYKKHYKITLEGKTDTKHPDSTPEFMVLTDTAIHGLVDKLNSFTAWNSVAVKEVKR